MELTAKEKALWTYSELQKRKERREEGAKQAMAYRYEGKQNYINNLRRHNRK